MNPKTRKRFDRLPRSAKGFQILKSRHERLAILWKQIHERLIEIGGREKEINRLAEEPTTPIEKIIELGDELGSLESEKKRLVKSLPKLNASLQSLEDRINLIEHRLRNQPR